VLEESDDPMRLSSRLNALIEWCRAGRGQYQTLIVIQPGCSNMSVAMREFESALTEDCSDEVIDDEPSYVDFLCDIHRLIQDKMA
jgi:hypothetical protein